MLSLDLGQSLEHIRSGLGLISQMRKDLISVIYVCECNRVWVYAAKVWLWAGQVR